jgi:hypothetical protein
MTTILIATGTSVLRCDVGDGRMTATTGLDGHRATCLAADAHVPGRSWCGTHRGGVFRSDDAGASWQPVGLDDLRITAITASPAEAGVMWVGTEPSDVWRSADAGATWQRTRALDELPSSSGWAFPPRPDTHHVRWIAPHPRQGGRLWVAVEAGALVTTRDGGRSWQDRVPGGPYDTHELAIHPDAPDTLRVSAGDGYFESHDGGATWARPRDGLDVGYLRSVAIDPGRADVVLVSAASHAHAAYMAGRSDGRLYRREGEGPWTRVTDGWPDPPSTIAPLLMASAVAGELFAADERGVHRSEDGGVRWTRIAEYPTKPDHLRGLVSQ